MNSVNTAGSEKANTRKSNFKYCIVPKCTNTTVKSPDKLFISLPMDPVRRQLWQKAMRRDVFLGVKTRKYLCEDHFNLKEDMANYRHYEIMGKGSVNVKIKPGVVPHIFHCQKNKKVEEPSTSGGALESRTRPECITQGVLSGEEKYKLKDDTVNLVQPPSNAEIISPAEIVTPTTKDEGVQVNIKSKRKSRLTQCNENVEKRAIYVIERNPQLYLGIPSQSLFMIDLISAHCRLSIIEIFVTLKKIKLDYPYSVLADDFGVSPSAIRHAVQNSIPKLSSYFQKFIRWKTLSETQKCLPIPVRLQFKKVQSIIHCFEISIQKPSNPALQSLTWSEYKKANTMKYLISCTPDGLISYISNGFGGRTTDRMAVEESDFLSHLESGAHVLIDRGFEHIDELFVNQNNVLVRTPSVSANKKSTKEEAKYVKSVSSVRIHVERVISRVREFRLLGPHACVNDNLIKYLDDLVTIACGIVNIQDHVIK